MNNSDEHDCVLFGGQAHAVAPDPDAVKGAFSAQLLEVRILEQKEACPARNVSGACSRGVETRLPLARSLVRTVAWAWSGAEGKTPSTNHHEVTLHLRFKGGARKTLWLPVPAEKLAQIIGRDSR